MSRKSLWIIVGLLGLLSLLPLVGGAYALRIGTFASMYAILAVSWNVIGGMAGYPSFATAAFFGFGAYAGGLGTLANFASPDYMKSQDYKDYVSGITRPITEAVTEDIIPGIQSGFSRAGRYGSGAMGDITSKATGRAATAIGDVTSRIAQQERQNQFSAVTALPGFLSNLSGVTAGALAPSGILAGVGAQREAISGQPLQEAIRRFEYGEQLPYNQLAGYISSIYGSPLANRTASPQLQSNDNFQNIGALLNLATAVPNAVTGVKTGYDFLSGLIP